MTFDLILCLVDMSPASEDVLRWTRLWATQYGSRVEVLHALWPPVEREVSEEQGEYLNQEFGLRANELRRSIAARAEAIFGREIRYEAAVGVGHPVKVVLERIRQLRPGLTVLGGHGHDGMARTLLGSVAENVVRESTLATLVIKGKALEAGQTRLRQILCPVDRSDAGKRCLQQAAELAGKLEAGLDVLWVNPEGEKAAGQLSAWIPDSVRQRCRVGEAVRSGDVSEQIVLYARHHDSDLMVLGAEHRPFLEVTILGRTTERVVRHGPCPVLLLPLRAPAS